ncbi:MAG: exosortase/archaeosortase family protein [Planctomycetota bacterium]|jgi:exosortase
MSVATTGNTASIERSDAIRGPLVAAGLLLAVYTFVFWDFLATQVRWAWRDTADWGHTLVIPLIAAYFVYHDRRRLFAHPFRTTWLAIVPIVLGIGWYSLCSLHEALRNHNLQGFGAWLTLAGVVLLFCGGRAMRVLWFPLVYVLIFGQSLSERGITLLTFQLQGVAARGSELALILLGFDVDRSGHTLFVFNDVGESFPLNIAEACSGMRMLMAMVALGVAMAYLGLHRAWQRALLVVLAVPVAVLVNILRVVTLALLALLDTGFAAGDFHSFVGLVWLVPALLIYSGLTWIIRHLVVEPGTAAGGER